ncbi:MAG: helix-turn-helix domain-containing protein [Candidatus Levybacteria bacterium]|nr:helix-turn-helix domain-containing protein [Candidatus Levybacteria bacterium]
MSLLLDNTLFTVQEVAALLKLSALTVYKYIKEQRLEAIEFGGHYRIQKSALDKFIEDHKVKPSLQAQKEDHEAKT